MSAGPGMVAGRVSLTVDARVWRRIYVACAVLCALALAALIAAVPASAGTTKASTLTKTGTDVQTGTTVSGGGAAATTHPGDTINWVLTYRNTTGSSANATITDPIGANQSFVHGSLQTPAGFSPGWSTNAGSSYGSSEPTSGVNAVRAAGTVPQPSAVSPAFSANTLSFTTPGGDGYSVEGLGNNIYTVFHHSSGGTTVYCATLAGAVCPGWPAHSTYVNPTAGTPIGTGGVGAYTTAGENGSFIANGNLYWGVQATTFAGGTEALGVQCLNLTTLLSCGLTHLDSTTLAPTAYGAAQISADGIPAADGNYYFFDGNGNMLCFSPTSGACGNVNISAGETSTSNFYTASILTSGQYVYVTYISATGLHMSCYNTATSALCAGFPKNEGVAVTVGFPDFIAPVLSTGGTLLGACDVNKTNCYSPTGAAIVNPYPGRTGFQDVTPPGFGSGAIVGSRFYTTDGSTVGALCFDFAAWTGTGAVPSCSGFSGPVDSQNYTTRPLANLPGCMAADGNAGQIVIYNADTGGSCVTATSQVKLTPHTSYCDGQSHAAPTWGTLVLNGLNGSQYAYATVTLSGASGPVPGYTNLKLNPGQTTLDLSSLPVSGNTAALTAEVTLSAVNNTAAVSASTITLAWSGAPLQVCFQTVAGPSNCNVAQSITNSGNAVTTGTISDAPAGNNSGDAIFVEAANPTTANCQADLAITKSAAGASVAPGGQVMYTLVVQNNGPDTATNAHVSDAIPADLTIISARPTQGSCTTAGSIDCSLGTILDGGSAQILVTATVASTATGTITNCASTSAFQTDPNLANNNGCALVSVHPSPSPVADLQMFKSVNHRHATLGQVLTYTLRVHNAGPDAAPDGKITDTSAIGMKVLSVTASQGHCVNSVPFTCDLGALGLGKTATIKVRAIPSQMGSEINSVTATDGCTASGSCATDPNPGNNVSAAQTSVDPSLMLSKRVDRSVVSAGQNVTYHLKVTNPTSVTVAKVKVCDALPAGLLYVGSTPQAHLEAGRYCWSIARLGAHRSASYTVVANAAPGNGGSLVNHATASAPGVATVRASARVRVLAAARVPCGLASAARAHQAGRPRARIAC